MTQLLNPKPPHPNSKLPPPFFTHDEPKVAAVMRMERQRRHRAGNGGAGTAATAAVVLGLFLSDFWSIKYMDKIHRRMYGRWKIMNFLLFNK